MFNGKLGIAHKVNLGKPFTAKQRSHTYHFAGKQPASQHFQPVFSQKKTISLFAKIEIRSNTSFLFDKFSHKRRRNDDEEERNRNHNFSHNLFSLLFGGSLALLLFNNQTSAEEQQNDNDDKESEKEEEEKEETTFEAGDVIEGLPNYTIEEVSKHKTKETRIWVTYRNGVYDVTEFVSSHPGGLEKIMLGAGKAIDPFWSLYAAHKVHEIFEILEAHRIGNLAPEDRDAYLKLIGTASNGPYANDPPRSPVLQVLSSTPFNAEPPATLLAQDFVTNADLFYVRNHLPVPKIESKDDYYVDISFDSEDYKQSSTIPSSIRFSISDIENNFPIHTITATLQCSGNRRQEFASVKEVLGLPWQSQAISTAEWTGIKLRDLLLHAGMKETLNPDSLHLHFDGADTDISGMPYGASIPLQLVMNPNYDILLAFKMNGEDIPRDHGYPLRVIVPGVTGARNVKWLKRIHVTNEESKSHWQRKDYKFFPSNTEANTANWETAESLQDMPVQSAILSPSNHSTVYVDSIDGEEEVEVHLKGYAWSGGGRGITRVEISADNGKTWNQATLQSPNQPYGRVWAWTLWESDVTIPADSKEASFICRAIDTSGNHQPADLSTVWNFRGLSNNAVSRVTVGIVKADDD